jgi:hypothetical protein
MVGGRGDQDEIADLDALCVAGCRHRAGARDDHVDLLCLLVRAKLLGDAGRDLEPVDREIARPEFARVHEDVRPQAMHLFDGGIRQAPDEHRAFLPDRRRGGVEPST